MVMMLIPLPVKYNKGYKHFAKILFLVTNGIGFASNFLDVVYFRYILRRTDFGIFSEFKNESYLWKVVLVGLFQYWYLPVCLSLVIWFLWWVYGDHHRSRILKSNISFYISSIVIMFLSAGLTVAGIRGGFKKTTRPITISNAITKVKLPIESAIVLNTPFSIIRTIYSKTFKTLNYFTEEEIYKIYSPIHKGYPPGSFKPMNVVVLILESFTKEVIGSLNKDLEGGNYKGYTPFLDSLIQKSYVWQYSYANGIKSIDAIPSVIAGIPSLVQPFVLSRYSLNAMDGLASALKKKGYETAFYHGAPNGSMGFDAITHMLSIEKYFGQNEYGKKSDSDGFWGIPDELFLNYMAKTAGDLKQPFFVSLFTLSSHHPYVLPKEYSNKFKGGINPLYKSIEYSDFSLRKFFEEASKKDWYQNTLFVITADHSLPSQDHGEYKNSAGLFSVPIIYFRPDGSLIGHNPSIIQQIDIFPTILGYLKYDSTFFAFGTDRFNPDQKPFVVNYINGYYQFMDEEYLLQTDGNQITSLYFYKEDKLLQNNMADRQNAKSEALMKRFKAFLQQYNNLMIENKLTLH